METNDAGELNQSVEDTLKTRGTRYGDFVDNAKTAQALKKIVRSNELPEAFMREAMEMICHKMARIEGGDPYYDDSWRDIAGFAQLVVDILNRDK